MFHGSVFLICTGQTIANFYEHIFNNLCTNVIFSKKILNYVKDIHIIKMIPKLECIFNNK